MSNTPYTKAVADLHNNQEAHICGALMELPDGRQVTVHRDGVVRFWKEGESGKLFLCEKKPYQEVVGS